MQHIRVLATVFICTLMVGSAHAQSSKTNLDVLRQHAQQAGGTYTVSQAAGNHAPLANGFRLPPDWRERASFIQPPSQKEALPAQFDWRALNGCTPIRDQGQCGSCWAFATVGLLECNIRIKDGASVDLSEQWLVSCDTDDDGCAGGFWAFDYFMTKTDACGGTGAVLESAFPYQASNLPCNCPYNHVYTINSWSYVAGEEEIPSPDAIKWAIMTYGPVAVGVCVGDDFAYYSGGVFNYNFTDELNHAIVLVGWDDSQGENGVWILRNSWGSTDWGEQGYMRIEYGCSMVGYAAAVIDYAGQTPQPGPEITVQPTGGRVKKGFTHVFSIEASNAKSAITYQWFRDGQPVSGVASSNFLVIDPVDLADEGSYTCTVKDIEGTTISDAAYLDVEDAALPLSITYILLPLLGAFAIASLRHLAPQYLKGKKPRS